MTDSKINLATLSHDDILIIGARQKGIAFADMTDQQFDIALTGIIFNVSVICGCQLPVNEHHVKALERELAIFLKDYGYTSLTSEEILTAFRMNAAGQLQGKIEVYGSVFNLDYAGKVIRQYRDKRFRLDLRLGQDYIQKERDEIIEQEDNERRKKIQAQYKTYLSDNEAELDLNNCYMQLAFDGAFEDGNVYLKFTERPELILEGRGKYASLSPRNSLNAYGEYMDLAFETQRLCVKYLFYNMMKYGYNDVYDENLRLIHLNFSIPEGTVLPKENINLLKEEDINNLPF